MQKLPAEIIYEFARHGPVESLKLGLTCQTLNQY
jgi:hypothetical protein